MLYWFCWLREYSGVSGTEYVLEGFYVGNEEKGEKEYGGNVRQYEMRSKCSIG